MWTAQNSARLRFCSMNLPSRTIAGRLPNSGSGGFVRGGSGVDPGSGRVRDTMAKQRVSSTALAEVIGITHSTVQRIISPSSQPPGEKTVAALQAWVDTHTPTATGAPPFRATASYPRRRPG